MSFCSGTAGKASEYIEYLHTDIFRFHLRNGRETWTRQGGEMIFAPRRSDSLMRGTGVKPSRVRPYALFQVLVRAVMGAPRCQLTYVFGQANRKCRRLARVTTVGRRPS